MEYVMSLVHAPGPEQFSLNPDAVLWLSVDWHGSHAACPFPTIAALRKVSRLKVSRIKHTSLLLQTLADGLSESRNKPAT